MFKIIAIIAALADPSDVVELTYQVEVFETIERCEAAKPGVQELLNAYLEDRGVDLTLVKSELLCVDVNDARGQ